VWLVAFSLFGLCLLLRKNKDDSKFYMPFAANIILTSVLFYVLSPRSYHKGKDNIEFFHNKGVEITFINSASRRIIIFEGSAGTEDNFVLSIFAKSLFNRGIDSIDCLVVPKFSMKQITQLIRINDVFHVKEAVFFSEPFPLLRDILSNTADKLRFITCKNFSQDMPPSPICENLRYRFLSDNGNLGICYQGSRNNFLLYYGTFRNKSAFWQDKNIYGVKLPKVFPKKELVRIINAKKAEVIIFPRSYKRYGIVDKGIRLVNLAKARWAEW